METTTAASQISKVRDDTLIRPYCEPLLLNQSLTLKLPPLVNDARSLGKEMENAVATRMKQLTIMSTDPVTSAIDDECSKTVSALKLTPQKDFIGTIACIAPKYCPALYRELSDCYHSSGRSTRPCRPEVINVFACTNDFVFRKSERFFAQVDQLDLPQMTHPATNGRPSARPGPNRASL